MEKIREWPRQLYRNPDSLDRYGLYTGMARADDETALKLLLDPEGFDPTRTLILAPDAPDHGVAAGPGRPRQPGDARVLEYSPNRVALECDAPAPAFLSIAEQYFPGWRAWVDGRETMLARANYAYQALPLKTAGRHRVILKFVPLAFRVGLWAGLASIAALMAFAAVIKFGAGVVPVPDRARKGSPTVP